MACSCHGKLGVATKTTSPNDQCTTCARKHIRAAWSKWSQFTYQLDNRQYVAAQIRDAADHLKYDHTDIALRCRDLAVAIEQVKDKQFGSIYNQLDKLRCQILQLYFQDHPDAKQRLQQLKEQSTQ